jgi:hypothetical protein
MTLKLRTLASWARQPRNRWLVLGSLATAALALVVLLSLAGWFSRDGETRRGAVAEYIADVNATQREFGVERQRVSNIYEQARKNPRGLAGDVAALDDAAATLRRFHARIGALEPPPDATKLHRRLVALTAAEAAFAADIARLGRFLTLLTDERRGVARASQSLRDDLATAANVGAQAALFERFSSALATVDGPLRRGPVPTPLKPIKAEELARITALAASAHALAGSLRAGSATDTAAYARNFSVAAAGSGNAVERAAIVAFDGKARTINELRTGVANEQTRLERALP